jgi:DNA-directed RNA polymerase I, II, and III subunit RPABC2
MSEINDIDISDNESETSDNESETSDNEVKNNDGVEIEDEDNIDIIDEDEDEDEDGDEVEDGDEDDAEAEIEDMDGDNITSNKVNMEYIGGDDADDISEEESDDEEDNEDYLQKFGKSLKENIISDYHPDLKLHNESEIKLMSMVSRNANGIIIDVLHTTIPFITKYEKARIIGERTSQLNSGAKPFIDVDDDVIDGYLIALEEFKLKKIPFIIKRPLPNGKCEYWKLSDLEII